MIVSHYVLLGIELQDLWKSRHLTIELSLQLFKFLKFIEVCFCPMCTGAFRGQQKVLDPL